jgi:MoaA/NifB/PqqE/SkfB family radical SAM enzyme
VGSTTSEVTLPVQDDLHGYVDPEGRIVLPPEMRARLGLLPAAEITLEEMPNGISLRRPITHLAKLYLEPTNRCNLDCRICIRNSWDEAQGDMSEETFARLLEGMQQLEYKPVVVFGGFGEPLFHPDIVEMVARVRQVATRLELITNGLLLSDQMARDLIRAGLNMLWISADALHTGANGRPSNALASIENLHRLRFSLHSQSPETGIVMVATPANMNDFPDLLRKAARYGVSRYMLTNMLPYTAEMCNQTLYGRALDRVASRPTPMSPSVQLPRIDWNEQTVNPLAQVLRTRHNVSIHGASLDLPGGRCPFIESGALTISWDGAVSPCLGLMHGHVSYLYDTPRAVTRYVIGNINDAALEEIWRNTDHLAFRQRVREFDFSPCTLCASCEMAESNEEDCYGNTFPTCGGCLWAWGVIQCP